MIKIFPVIPTVLKQEVVKKDNNHNIVVQKTNDSASNILMPLHSSNEYLVNFKGLSRGLSKKAYHKVDIQEKNRQNPKSKGIVGNLPPEIIAKMPKDKTERALKIKELYAVFNRVLGDFAINPKKNSQDIANELQKRLIKLGLIDDTTQISLKRLGSGGLGTVYRLSGFGDKKYALKVFNINNIDDDCHGIEAEVNRALYWQSRVGKGTQKIPFYWGDVDAKYMVSEISSSNTPPFRRYVSEARLGLEYADVVNPENIVHGYDVDWGEIVITDNILNKNKTAQWAIKQLETTPTNQRLAKWAELLKIKHNNDGIKLGLLCSFDLVPEKSIVEGFDEILEGANEELKIALAGRINALPEESIVTRYDKLLTGAGEKLKIALSHNIVFLPEGEKRLRILKELLNNKKVIEELGERLTTSYIYLNKAEIIMILKSMIDELGIKAIPNIVRFGFERYPEIVALLKERIKEGSFSKELLTDVINARRKNPERFIAMLH